jgi:L-rhamnose mutarotase
VDFLVAETSEDAVFCFISAVSCFGITDREDAIAAMEKDPDTRKWAIITANLIPEPYVHDVKVKRGGGDA